MPCIGAILSGPEMGILVLAGLVALGGLLLLVLGVRGRAVGDTECCRRCGTEVGTLPQDVLACPRCKADLTRAGAVRIGRRATRRGLVLAGVAVTLLGSAIAGRLVYHRVSAANLNRLKSTERLLQETDGQDPAKVDAALSELVVRMDPTMAHSLEAAQTAALTQRALAAQAERQRPWQPKWGTAVEAARVRGAASDAQWQQYWQQAAQATLSLRERIRPGDPLPLALRVADFRVSSAAQLDRADLTVAAVTVDGQPWEVRVEPIQLTMDPKAAGLLEMLATGAERLAPGSHQAAVTLAATVVPRRKQAVPPAAWTLTVQRSFTVLDAAAPPTVRLQPDPEQLRPVRRAIAAHSVEVVAEGGRQYLQVVGHGSRPPVDVAFEVSVVIGPQRWPAGHIAFAKGASERWQVRCPLPADFPAAATQADVLLRASADAACRSVSLTTIWDGEFKNEDRPIRRPGAPATQPK